MEIGEEKIFIAGSGGQGILSFGKILAQAAVESNKYVSYYPSYGAEIRGGTANCTLIISDREIASPVTTYVDTVIFLNNLSFLKFFKKLKQEGLLLINSSLCNTVNENLDQYYLVKVKATHLAEKLGDVRCANVIMLGAYVSKKKILSVKNVMEALNKTFKENSELCKLNIKAFESGLKT